MIINEQIVNDDEESRKNGSIYRCTKTYNLVYPGHNRLSITVRNNFPTNNERMPYPYSQRSKNTTKNEYISHLQALNDIKAEYRVRINTE